MNQSVILDWYLENKRDLPWRNTTPWGVMVSEFMLQQTPVNRVLPVWTEWLHRWPTPKDLASEKRSEVIKAWGRLGYPRRALRLHESSIIIARDFNNAVPHEIERLRTLPGVGEYTAAAIIAFAFGNSELVLDINIRRFFARAIDGVQYPTSSPSKYERQIRAELIPSEGALWAAATMEFGALICTSKNPNCEACPLSDYCAWRRDGYPESEQKRKIQAWHGTDRQCRGTVVQALRDHPLLTKEKAMGLWPDSLQLEKALKTLIADGLIEPIGDRYQLAEATD